MNRYYTMGLVFGSSLFCMGSMTGHGSGAPARNSEQPYFFQAVAVGSIGQHRTIVGRDLFLNAIGCRTVFAGPLNDGPSANGFFCPISSIGAGSNPCNIPIFLGLELGRPPENLRNRPFPEGHEKLKGSLENAGSIQTVELAAGSF